jgi:hypothetical protein
MYLTNTTNSKKKEFNNPWKQWTQTQWWIRPKLQCHLFNEVWKIKVSLQIMLDNNWQTWKKCTWTICKQSKCRTCELEKHTKEHSGNFSSTWCRQWTCKTKGYSVSNRNVNWQSLKATNMNKCKQNLSILSLIINWSCTTCFKDIINTSTFK